MKISPAWVLALAVIMAASGAARAQNTEAGRNLFRARCAACHMILPGKKLIGPSLFGIVGRKSGAVEGFVYSDANRNARLTWDEATLDRYLAAPRDVMPGTKMTFGGLRDAGQRRDLIAYLATLQ